MDLCLWAGVHHQLDYRETFQLVKEPLQLHCVEQLEFAAGSKQPNNVSHRLLLAALGRFTDRRLGNQDLFRHFHCSLS